MSFVVVTHADAVAFRDRVLLRLMEAEAENCRIISLAMALAKKHASSASSASRFWSVESDAGVELVALQKFESLLEISRGSAEAAEALIDALISDGGVPAIAGPTPTIEAVASGYAKRAKLHRKLHRRYQCHSLNCVQHPKSAGGAMRRCDESDRQLLCNFINDYMHCINEPPYPDTNAVANDLIVGQRMHFWCNPRPVAMAAWAGPTPNGIRINFVYTPPEFRGRGYASNLVAALSQKLLNEGRRSCFLFTDSSNARAEQMYARIGYQPISEGAHWVFVAATQV